MSDIVKYDSLDFKEIRENLEGFLALTGEIDPADFNATSTLRRVSDAIAGLYNQLRIKIDNVRKESIMDSAVRPESIRYLAMSQLSYSPKRRIAPQHPSGRMMWFRIPEGTTLNPRSILGNITIDGESYPISMLELPILNPDTGIYRARLCIGEWKEKEFNLSLIPQYTTPFYNFRVEGDRDVIDDSGTVSVDVYYNSADDNGIEKEFYTVATVVEGLQEIPLYTAEERANLCLVKSSYFGGLDLNFGDGIVFGNLLYQDAPTKVVVTYLDTPGFIPNLAFIAGNISWDGNIIDEESILVNGDQLVLPGPSEYEKGPFFDIEMGNGISPETTAQIKTLSPYVAMANQRIMTNDDFISRVLRIPNIKSAFSMPEHIEPGQPGAVSPLVPTATFNLSGLTLAGVFPWRLGDVYGEMTIVSWIEFDTDGNPAHKLFRLEDPTKDGTIAPNVLNSGWVEITADEASEYQALTQIEWDLNYHQQYNFDTLLGFMRVRVKPPRIAVRNGWRGRFELDVQIAPYVRGGLTPSEINDRVREIILSYCWDLGAFLDVGELVARINDVNGVLKTYLKTPVQNIQLEYDEYIKPDIQIDYTTNTSRDARFGKN